MIRKYSPLLSDNPLCGIDTDKDTLNLSTGLVTRTIKKRVITNEDIFSKSGDGRYAYFVLKLGDSFGTELICSHFPYVLVVASTAAIGASITASSYNLRIRPANVENTSADQFNQWISEQYLAGTPVTIWYVLAEPTTETITVPTGLSGTVEGYLTQNGTPSQTNPVYPIANSAPAFKEWFYRKYGTETDTLTSFPAEIIGDGTNATAVIKGNLLQSGTPTAASPIYPSECGDKTDNLYNVNATDTTNGYISGQYIRSTGKTYTPTVSGNASVSEYIEIEPNETYTQTDFYTGESNAPAICFYDSNYEYISGVTILSGATFMTPNTAKYLRISKQTSVNTSMLSKGPTAKTFEPYGYKIPVSLSQTPIYITDAIRKIDGITTPIERTTGGSDEITSNGTLTREITKMELDGTEGEWRKGGGEGNMAFFVNSYLLNGVAGSPILCSHFPVGNVGSTTTDIGIFIGSTGSNLRIRPENVASMELTDWTTWLSNQKAAGTPVTIYYVAVTPTTEQVTVPTLPTTGTPEQFDVNTTLKPSEVDLTYHGWHGHSDTKFTT